MKIKNKMILGSTLLAVVPVVIASIVMNIVAVDTSSEALKQQVKNQLVSIRDTKKVQIEDYFQTIYSQLLNLAAAPAVQYSLNELPASFDAYAAGHSDAVATMRDELAGYYRQEFAKEYSRQNSGQSVDASRLLSGLSDKAVVLQHSYIFTNPHPLGSKNTLNSADNNSRYDALHRNQHPYFNDFINRFGYYDLFLVDNRGNIVYSVYKELDFATNLNSGPYADSGIARAFNKASQATQGKVVIDDFAPYRPSYDGPASFAATPVFEDGKRLGVLILQMPIAAINSIMTSDKKWKDVGLGDSGETYLVGPDKKARSASRFLIEDKAGYLEMLRELQADPALVKAIDAKGTNIGLQVIDTTGTRAALGGESGFQLFPDYRDVAVLSAYTPLDIPGLNWALMSEIDEAEAFSDVENMAATIRNWAVTIAVAIFLVAGAVGFVFSVSITRPILRLAEVIGIIDRDADLSRRIDIDSQDEIGDMSRSFNQMLEKLHNSMREVTSSTSQLAAAAEELSAITIDTNNAIESQRSETEQVATAMNEMNATVQEVANSATSAAEAAGNADNEASSGRNVVRDTIESIDQLAGDVEGTATIIKKLEGETESIGTVLDVIRGIAEQTNLLALNAAIEAARAGEQGRGFAVVADEVRSLASRTQASTQEIQAMIERLQGEARKAVVAMEQGQERAHSGVEKAAGAGESLEAITRAVAAISDMNTHIASAAEEQSAVADEINRNISNISQVAEQNTENANQTSRASEELAHLASELQSLVSQFKI
jgi:methyl-accepting chemotaxis protein